MLGRTALNVNVEPLKSRAGMLSQLRVLTKELGDLRASALERPGAIEDCKARYADRAVATMNRYLSRFRHIANWAIGRDLLGATPFHRRGVRIPAKSERRRERRVSEAEEQRLLDACKLLNEPTRPTARLTWDDVRDIREQAKAGVPQHELATAFHISRPLCNEIVRGHIWDPDVELTTGDEMRDRIIGALDTGCRRGEMMKIQNKHADWQHRWIDLHWHDLRHEALSRLADDGVPVHELQLLAGHASITTTQRYMNARANSLAESMRRARERRVKRVEQHEDQSVQVG